MKYSETSWYDGSVWSDVGDDIHQGPQKIRSEDQRMSTNMLTKISGVSKFWVSRCHPVIKHMVYWKIPNLVRREIPLKIGPFREIPCLIILLEGTWILILSWSSFISLPSLPLKKPYHTISNSFKKDKDETIIISNHTHTQPDHVKPHS